MSGPDHETLTAALRRLADEHATGLLSVATAGADVVIGLADGAPVTIGPVHDVRARVGDGAADDVIAAVVVDELVDRTVAAVVHGESDWTWDVTSSADRLPLPDGLAEELARRAVDAAQALGTAGADAVLAPTNGATATGELERVRALFDGTRTVAEVAEAADLTLPTVATMAAALLDGGALTRTETQQPVAADPVEQTATWTETVAASEHDDESDDDEPELWVMGPSEDEEDEGAGHDERTVPQSHQGRPETHRTDAAEADDAAPRVSWNDTSWLDDLSGPPDDDAPPVLSAGDGDTDTRAALGSMLSELQRDDPDDGGTPAAAPRRHEPDQSGHDDSDDAPLSARPAEPLERHEPKAEPGDVAEFLRELSRLALDDD